jgi:MYXO-CTERM domain-containing protein
MLALALALAAAPRTQVVVDTPVPAAPRYSQAVTFTAHLEKEDGTPINGQDSTLCGAGQPCRFQILVAAEGQTALFLVDPAIAADGTATVRIPFVDGTLNQNVTYAATAQGAPYVVSVKFLGSLQGASAGDADCAAGAVDSGTTGLCPSAHDVDINLFSETTDIEIGAGLEGNLSTDTCDPTVATSCTAPFACDATSHQCGLLLTATLTDPNGDADVGGTNVDGPGPKNLEGQQVTFFYDADNNGRPGANEELGTSATNAAGVASLVFVLDPTFVRAGTYETGIFAEFGGDAHYGVAEAHARLIVHPADIDVARTLIDAKPASIPADGVSKSQLVAHLVDKFNNPLDASSDAHHVVFTTDLGHLEGPGTRDDLNGTYTTALDAGRLPGTATVKISVDGVDGPVTKITITGHAGCQCSSTSDTAPFALALAALALLRRRR